MIVYSNSNTNCFHAVIYGEMTTNTKLITRKPTHPIIYHHTIINITFKKLIIFTKTIILSGQKRTDERLAGQSHCAKFTVVIDTNVDLIELRGEEKKQKKTQKEKKKKKKQKKSKSKSKSKSKELVKKHAILRALKKKQNKAKQNQTKGNEENRKQKGKRAEI